MRNSETVVCCPEMKRVIDHTNRRYCLVLLIIGSPHSLSPTKLPFLFSKHKHSILIAICMMTLFALSPEPPLYFYYLFRFYSQLPTNNGKLDINEFLIATKLSFQTCRFLVSFISFFFSHFVCVCVQFFSLSFQFLAFFRCLVTVNIKYK